MFDGCIYFDRLVFSKGQAFCVLHSMTKPTCHPDDGRCDGTGGSTAGSAFSVKDSMADAVMIVHGKNSMVTSRHSMVH